MRMPRLQLSGSRSRSTSSLSQISRSDILTSSAGKTFPQFFVYIGLNKHSASFAGNRIVLRQTSPEAESIYDFILALHRAAGGDWKALAEKGAVDEAGLNDFLHYAAQFLGNAGNYKSFGDVSDGPDTIVPFSVIFMLSQECIAPES
jgi:hypothetical protein